MTQAEVKAHIERNLIAAGLPIEDLRVQPDTILRMAGRRCVLWIRWHAVGKASGDSAART